MGIVNNNSIISFWKESLKLFPNKVAIEDNGIYYTYNQIDDLSNRFANHLTKLHADRNEIFAIYGTKNANYISCVLALWKLSYAFVPLDSDLPLDRIKYILRSGNIRYIISELENNSLQKQCTHILYKDMSMSPSILEKDNILTGDNIAYIIYTSGSTGFPKGVAVSNDNLVNFFSSISKYIPISENDRLLSITTISFDISILEIFLPLFCGATLVVGSKRMLIDGYMLQNSLQKNNISIMQATPITWEMLFNTGWTNTENIKILCGGEKLSETLAKKLCENASHIYHLYGPTETTIWSSVQKLTSPFDIHLGDPIDNTDFYVLDENMHPVQEGELYIGGRGVAIGYYRQIELTKGRFLNNPFSRGIIYKTGDLVKMVNKHYCYIGRADFQVKINGHRIELEEIEQVAINSNLVKNSVAVVDQTVKAIYLFVNQCSVSMEELYQYLQQYLPNYMLPKQIVPIDEFPLTFNKKIDRNKLLGDYLAKQRQVRYKKSLHEIWEETLKLKIDPNCDYSLYVADSLTLIKLCCYMKEFGYSIGLDDLIRLRTVNNLQKYCNSKSIEKSKIAQNKNFEKFLLHYLSKGDNYEIFSLSNMQIDMLLDYYINNNNNYVESYILEFPNRIGLTKKLIESTIKITNRIDILKTIYYFDKRGGSLGIYSPNLKNIKNIIIKCDSDQAALLKAFDFTKSPYEINKVGLEATVFIGEQNLYFVLRYHHIRLDMDSFYNILGDILDAADDNKQRKRTEIKRNYFGHNYPNIVLDAHDTLNITSFCRKNNIQLGIFLQWLILKSWKKCNDELSYDIVLKDWKDMHFNIGNHINVFHIEVCSEVRESFEKFKNAWESCISNNCRPKHFHNNLIIINYVQGIADRLDFLFGELNFKVTHIENNGYRNSIVINILDNFIEINEYMGDAKTEFIDKNQFLTEINKLII